MLRRSAVTRLSGAFKATTVALNSSIDRNAEIQREQELRARVVGKMAMNFPTYDHTTYASYETSAGQFNSGGAGLNGNSSSSSSGTSSAQQQQPQMPRMPFPFNFGGGNKNNTNNNDNGGTQQQSKPPNTASDYFVFATGLVLIVYSIKLLMKGAGANSDGTLIPMWATTPMMKSKYILFSVITTEQEREALKNEFALIQKQMPFLSFFDWLDQRYPNWGGGRRYSQEQVINAIAQSIAGDYNAGQMARLMAGVIQKRSGGLFGLTPATQPNADRQTLVDEMMDTIQGSTTKNNANNGGFFGGFANNNSNGGSYPAVGGVPPFVPNVNPQWGMPQQHQQMSYNNYSAQPHQYVDVPPQQYGQQQQQQYYQQPQGNELRGTQEVSISDITGSTGAVPQHHFEAPTNNGAGSGTTTTNNDISPREDIPQRDPLARTQPKSMKTE